MDKITFHRVKAENRLIKLNEYYLKNIQSKGNFICSGYNNCRSSHPGDFYEGQLSYLGKLYDSSINGFPFRIMIVGQEYGTKDRFVSVENRAEMIHKSAELSFTRRNQHMRGTTSVLRLLFNKELGRDPDSEFLSVNNKKYHIFDASALVNFLLCSAVNSSEGKKGRATDEMKINCSKHFRASLEILEPTVIILQSKGFINSFLDVFDDTEYISEDLYIGKIKNNRIFLACFSHPSTPTNKYNWGRDEKTQYLLKTVAPTINIITENYSRIF